jgi:hypothetical protein
MDPESPTEATQAAPENKSLANMDNIPGFLDAVKNKYLERHAEKALQLIEERDRLKKALDKYEKWVSELEAGNVKVLDQYSRERKKLEDQDLYEF